MRTETNSVEQYTVFDRTITINHERDELLTPFGKETLRDRYLWQGENFQKMFARVAAVNSDDNTHAQRMYDYISQLWFMPATPVLSNSGHEKNLSISCFLNSAGDNLEEIFGTLNENNWLAARGGGIGTYWNLRPLGEGVADRGTTSGVIPFLKMQDSATLGVSQGNLRRGSSAAYLDVSHAEIEEFIDMRRPTGDINRQCLNIHHGVNITNNFMRAVKNNEDWHLFSCHTGKLIKTVRARDLFQRIVIARLETGEPYMWFVDTVNERAPDVYKLNNLKNYQSNLCSEISLATGLDYNNRHRTAVCCLSSLNLEKYHEWGQNENIVEDCLRFLDNVLSRFIAMTENMEGFERARYAAEQERSIGLGVMGFHSFLQSKMIPFEGVMAKVWNKRIFAKLKADADKANVKVALERGSCPDAERVGLIKRWSHMFAIAPTASISIIAGESSPGIEPWVVNSYTQKTLSGSFNVRNKWLAKLLSEKIENWMELEEVWEDITQHSGSIQHLTFLTQDEKDVFKTAFELDQRWILEHAEDRQDHICQGQSLNVFLPATVSKKELVQLHIAAWEKGLKGLYYCRSLSIARPTELRHKAGEMPEAVPPKDYDECLACQ